MSKEVQQIIKEHAAEDKERFESIQKTLDTIKDNHLAHIQASMATLEANYDWLKNILWLGVAGIIGGFIIKIWEIIK